MRNMKKAENRKNKERIAKGTLVVLLLLVMVFTAACGGDAGMSDMELYEKAVRANLDRTSYSFDGEMSLGIEEFHSEDPEAAMMMGMFGQLGMTMSGAVDQSNPENLRFYLDGQLNAMGMGIDMEMIMADNVMALRLPMINQFFQDPRLIDGYLVMELDQMDNGEEFYMDGSFDEEDLLALVNYFGEMTLSIMEDDFIENLGEQTITIDGSDHEATELQIIIGEEEFERIWRAIPEILEDGELRALLENLVGEDHQGEMNLELDSALELLDEEAMEEALEEIKEVIDFERSEIRYSLIVDAEYRIIKEEGNFTLAVSDGEDSGVFSFEMTMRYWDINQDVNIQMPELNEENSVHLEELLENLFMFPEF